MVGEVRAASSGGEVHETFHLHWAARMNESERLCRLADYGILDTEPDATLDEIVALAARVCECPIAALSLVDADRLWFKARVGLGVAQVPREDAFCLHAVAAEGDGIFTVPDARTDIRFARSALVVEPPNIVFYAGAPLVVEGGAKLGTFCVIDHQPRVLRPVQEQTLRTLSNVVIRHLEDRRRERDLATFRAFVEFSPDFVAFSDREDRVTYLNPAGRKLIGVGSLEDARRLKMADVFTSKEAVETAPTGTAGHFHGEAELCHRPSGAAIPVARDSFVVRDGSNQLVAEATIGRDLRDRKRIEEALARQSRETETARARLAAIFEKAPAFVCTLRGPEHVFELVNPHYQALVGAARPLVGRRVADAVPEVVGQGFIDALDRVYQTGEALLGNETPIKFDRRGDARLEDAFLNFVYQPERDANGAVAGIDVFGFDVTEQVHARQRIETLAEQVQASEAAWRLVTDALPVLVSFVTSDARYGLVNKAYEDWFGLSREQLLGRTVREIIGEAAYAVLGPNVERGLRGERFDFEQHGVPYRLGGTRDVKVKFVPHHDASGTPAGYTALLEDITQPRRLQREHERVSQQRSEVLEAMGDAFLALDARWIIILFNGEYERLTRKAAHELAGRDLRDVFPELRDPESPQFRGYHRCMTERLPVTFASYSEPRDQWLEVRVYASGEGGISVFFRDISAEKKAEEEARKKADFERQLIGIVSHDLRNPLNVILMASKILRRQEDLSAASTRHVVRIENAGERSMRLVRDLLDFTQAELGGGIRIERSAVDLHEVTRAVVDEIRATHPDRVIDLWAAGDGTGEWDPDRLSQVVQNLVTNALKYSAPGSPVTVATEDAGTVVSLLVHNSGPPIPADTIPTMFEPFERGAAHPDASQRSVGLGLYIVEQVVKAHGGTVTVESNDLEGTTFAVVLPRAPQAAPAGPLQ